MQFHSAHARRRILSVAICAAFVTVIAACSSGGGSSSSAGPGSAASASAGSSGNGGATTNLTVAYAATGAGFSDLYVGVADGIFQKYGLNVKLVQVTPANLIPSLLSGSAQIGGGVADGAAAAILKGEKLEYVALSEGTYNLQLWANKSVSSVQGLVGRGGDGSAAAFAYAASKNGVVGLMRSASYAYAEHNIRVNSVDPTGDATTPVIFDERMTRIVDPSSDLSPTAGNPLTVPSRRWCATRRGDWCRRQRGTLPRRADRSDPFRQRRRWLPRRRALRIRQCPN